MHSEFSPEFMDGLAKLLRLCAKENTDSLTLEFVSKSGIEWSVDMTFHVKDGDNHDHD